MVKRKSTKRDFLSLSDFSFREWMWIFKRAAWYKKHRFSKALKNKVILLLFSKPSTRTRVSFERGIYDMGGNAIYMDVSTSQMKRGETPEDTARVLSRYVDAVVVRTFSQEELERMASVASIPFINALTDFSHPAQIASDIFTVLEIFGNFQVKVAYVGDGNNVANSLIEASGIFPISLVVATPEGYEPSRVMVERARSKGANLILTHDPVEAVSGAHVIYTDVWVSMGQEGSEDKKRAFKSFQVNSELLSRAREDAVVMHCLPAHRGEEITDEVMDGPRSVVFDQAENRLHVQKAIMEALFVLEKS